MFATGGMGAGATGASGSFAMPMDVSWPGTDISNIGPGAQMSMAMPLDSLSGASLDTRGTPGSNIGRYAPQNPSVLPRSSPSAGPDVGGAVSLPEANPAFRPMGNEAAIADSIRSPADWTEADWARWERSNVYNQR